MEIFPPLISTSLSVNFERSIPAASEALQVIRIFRLPILYHVLSSLALMIFVTTYSAVARSLIFCKPNTCCILEGSFFEEHLMTDRDKQSIIIKTGIRIMQFTKGKQQFYIHCHIYREFQRKFWLKKHSQYLCCS